MKKVDRLATAAALAPFFREGNEAASVRRVGRLDASGNVVGYTTFDKVQQALLKRAEMDMETSGGSRPASFICDRCGLLYPTPAKGQVPSLCGRCKAYSAGIGTRTRAALSKKKANGERVGRIPFGYRLSSDGIHLEQDPGEQEVIDTIVALKAEGLSHRKIVSAAADLGLVSRAGAPFQRTQIARILRRVA